MSADSGSEAPRLVDAQALLRIARDADHIDTGTGRLSSNRISLQHLCGEPIAGKPGKRHSFSTFMLCNQTAEAIRAIAAQIAKGPPFTEAPKGAAGLCEELAKIGGAGAPALLLSEEEDENGLSGHVSIRFAPRVIDAGRPEQRRVCDALINAFGAVACLDKARSDKCR